MIQEKFSGCILGLAIGDAIGFPIEFVSLEKIHANYGNKGVQDFVPHPRNSSLIGMYSDDTEMSLAVARGLFQSIYPDDRESVMQSITKEFIKWSEIHDRMRMPGTTCLTGCSNLANGIHWQESGILQSKGCGAAMRSAPIGLFYGDIQKIVEISYAVSVCTHAHPTGVASGIATAILTNMALHSIEPVYMIPKLLELLQPYDTLQEMQRILELVCQIIAEPPEIAIPKIGQGWVGEEAVAIALYAFLKSPKDYTQTVLTAVNITGDSDSTGCIAGAISGAYNGIQAIPEKWINGVENKNLLMQIAKKLHDKKVGYNLGSGSERNG